MKPQHQLSKNNQLNTQGVVHYRVEQQTDGLGRISLLVDWERAPEPDHSYIADYFELHKSDSDVVIVLGKTEMPGGHGALRNKIEIYFPFHPFMNQFWKSSRRMHAALSKNFQEKGKTATAEGKLQAGPDAKIQTLAANNALVVMSAGQCVADFFLIPAKDIWMKTQKGGPLNITAIVRVFMSEHVLLGLLNRCDEVAQVLKQEIEISVAEEDDEVLESLDV
jgi:hypothetical protein